MRAACVQGALMPPRYHISVSWPSVHDYSDYSRSLRKEFSQGCSVFPAEWDMVQYLKTFGNCAYLPMACTHDTEISMIPLFSSHSIFWNCWAFAQEIFSPRWSLLSVVISLLVMQRDYTSLSVWSSFPKTERDFTWLLVDLAPTCTNW